MSSIPAIFRNLRPFEGRAYIALIGLALLMNLESLSPVELGAAFLAGVLFVWYAFSINNCFDVDTDSLNPEKAKKNPIASGELTLKEGLLASAALGICGVAIASATNREAFAVYITMTFLATLYSAPPRLKARPGIDLLSHGLFFGGLPFLYGALADGHFSGVEALIAVALTFYSFALELRNHLEDYGSDLKAGLRTTPIVIGRDRSELLADAFSLLAIGIVLYTLGPAMVLTPLLLVARRPLKIEPVMLYRVFDATMVAGLILNLSR